MACSINLSIYHTFLTAPSLYLLRGRGCTCLTPLPSLPAFPIHSFFFSFPFTHYPTTHKGRGRGGLFVCVRVWHALACMACLLLVLAALSYALWKSCTASVLRTTYKRSSHAASAQASYHVTTLPPPYLPTCFIIVPCIVSSSTFLLCWYVATHPC